MDSGLQSALVIQQSDRQDSGLYTCQADNMFGHSKQTTLLAVQGTIFRNQTFLGGSRCQIFNCTYLILHRLDRVASKITMYIFKQLSGLTQKFCYTKHISIFGIVIIAQTNFNNGSEVQADITTYKKSVYDVYEPFTWTDTLI